MRIPACIATCGVFLCLCGCSTTAPTQTAEVRVVPAGDKAVIGHLTYSVVDSQILPQLGDPANPRVPHDRFLMVEVAVTNSSNVDNPIPAIELIGDSGTTYNELPDGTGVKDWLGVVRHVGPSQTQRGEVLFDAPAAHYRLQFSDENTDNQIMADLPLSYTHEKMDDVAIPTVVLSNETAPTGSKTSK